MSDSNEVAAADVRSDPAEQAPTFRAKVREELDLFLASPGEASRDDLLEKLTSLVQDVAEEAALFERAILEALASHSVEVLRAATNAPSTRGMSPEDAEALASIHARVASGGEGLKRLNAAMHISRRGGLTIDIAALKRTQPARFTWHSSVPQLAEDIARVLSGNQVSALAGMLAGIGANMST